MSTAATDVLKQKIIDLREESNKWKRASERQKDENMALARRNERNEKSLQLEIQTLRRQLSKGPKEWTVPKPQMLKTQAEIETEQSKSFKNQIASKDKVINELKQQLSKRESEASSALLVKKELEAKTDELIALREKLEGQDRLVAEDQVQ